ncbi:MAG TPA: hypothetical protein VNZ52_12165 [Candidatus Thermoplasmatota archaeon]|nr:hypothetical protein [Candidatus Thermoplasmatota archaeon]
MIEDRMGENRSLTWMTLNRELSQYRPFVCPATLCAPHLTRPHYALSFHLQVPERPQVHWNFTVYLTPTGAPEEDPAVNSDLPRCKTVPEECAFEVGREEALEAAREHWSKEGHSPSHAAFTRFSRPGGAFPFAWAVYGPSDAEGQRVLYVHAGNGEVLGEEKRGHPTP